MSLPVPFRKYRLKGRRVGADELASLFGVSAETVGIWVGLGMPVADAAPLQLAFDCTEVTRWLIESEQVVPERDPGHDPLPPSAQEIADVIGRDRALRLIGKLPAVPGRAWRVCLYVPKRIGPDHPLVALAGWRDANLLVREFGGMILQPTNCGYLHRAWRAAEVRRRRAEGWQVADIADLLEISARQVHNILAAEIAPEEAQP